MTLSTSPETLEAEVQNIVFASEKGFTVARVTTEDGRLQTAVGNLAGIQPGELLRMQGRWVEDQRFGKQFSVESYMVETPRTIEGVERYLASGVLPGVGPKTAERIVAAFGTKTLDILTHEPESLHAVEGIGKARIEKIIAGWQERRALSEVMVFLQSYNISPAFASRIYKRYKEQAVAILRSNPYRLAWEIRGVGFKKADQIALEIGLHRESEERCAAALIYVLRSFMDQGHVFCPLDRLIQETMELINVSEEAMGKGIKRALHDGACVLEELDWQDEATGLRWRGQALYLSHMYEAEKGAAIEFLRLMQANIEPILPTAKLTEKLQAMQTRMRVTLGKEQEAALFAALAERISIITGGPGTGKTTMIRTLLAILQAEKKTVLLAAPTGRAAKRLAEATGYAAKTIHRLLEYRPNERGFARNRDNPLIADWVIVDETSMVDVVLMHHLLKAIPTGAALVLVGDVDQLPSVGSGSVLRDLIDSKKIYLSRLTEIYRQAADSLITLNAHSINRGHFPKLVKFDEAQAKLKEYGAMIDGERMDCLFIQETSPKRIVERIGKLCQHELPKMFSIDAFHELQVITPMHRGELGSRNLNQVLQATLNPKGLTMQRGEKIFRLHDRVMQVRNNYDKEVFNGDIGQITVIDADEAELKVRFDFVEATYTASELDEIELAYAVTVHKSQGSEYPVIVLPLTTQHFIMLQRNLLYTAITRGKVAVVLIGSSKAIALALKNDRTAKRYTYLSRRLNQSS